MEIIQAVAITLEDRSQISQARNLASSMAKFLGFDDTQSGKVALVVTELATNLIKHAQRGEILLQVVENRGSDAAMDIYAMDKGPGIANISKALIDGFSTAGSPGNGLGAIVRLSNQFDLYAHPQNGTVLFARCSRSESREAAATVYGAVSIPMPNEQVCGDSWCVIEKEKQKMLFVVDGLGHGPLAAEAARLAVRIFEQNSSRQPREILEMLHQTLRQTRGAAAAIAAVNEEEKQVCYAGVGNISGVLLTSAGSHNMVSQNGTLGSEIYKITEFKYELAEGTVIVMHSDGLGSRWDLRPYPGILYRSPSVIAGLLYRDWNKKRDDTTVLVYKTSPEVIQWNT